MKQETMSSACDIDRLIIKKLVPHIHEMIFLSLDYENYKACLHVSKRWKDLLTSEHFRKRGSSLFLEDIQNDILKAAKSGRMSVIKTVLTSFLIEVNFIARRKQTPLILAADNGNMNMACLLLEKGAEPNMANENGVTPLHMAACRGHHHVVELLLDRGAKQNTANDGSTPLLYAADKGYKDVVLLLLKRGADPNIAGPRGYTPLHAAAYKGHKGVAQILLSNGAELDIVNEAGSTPLFQAVCGEHARIVNLLLDRGAAINATDQQGWTPLHHAAQRGNKNIVQLLLKRGADPNKVNMIGKTPLTLVLYWIGRPKNPDDIAQDEIADENRLKDIAEILTKNGGINHTVYQQYKMMWGYR